MIRYILAILLLLPQFTYGLNETKNNKLSGCITDFDNGASLPGVSIFIPELQKGTASTANGKYLLENLPKGRITVQFSFVGYETVIKTIDIKKTQSKMNIRMPFTSVTTQDVVVSGGFPSAQHENSIKISVLPKAELKLLSSPSMGEKLASIPGVDIISRSPGVSTPVIRGLSLNNIIFLNNGVRLENFQFSPDHPFLVNDQGADHIEVIKGPASLLYGSDAMGGVINILREKPASANTLNADFTNEYHSVTHGYSTNVGVKSSQKERFWMIRVNQQSHKDYKDGEGNYIPNTRFNSKGLQLGLGIIKDFGSFKLYYDYLSPKLGMTNGKSIGLVNTENRKSHAWYQDLTQQMISSRNRLFLGDYKLELNAAYQFNQRRLNGDPKSEIFRLVDMDLKTFTYDAKLYFPCTMGSDFLIGLQGMHQSNTNQDAPNHIIPDAQIDDFSVFSLIKKKINKVALQFGLRYDHRKLYVPEQEAGGHTHSSSQTGSEERIVSINRNFNNLNTSLGATFNLSESLLLRTNFATGYRAPNLAELSQHGLHGNRFEEGNANLDPQKSLESDLGIHYHTHNHNIDLSWFYNKVYNYINLAPSNEPAPEGSGFVYKYGQQDAKLYGGEIAVNIAPLPYLKFHTDFAMVIAKQDDGERLPFIPQHKLNTSLRLFGKGNNIFHAPFLKLSWKHAFDQNNPAQFETKTKAYDLIGIQLGSDFKLGKYQANLLLSADNLFNEEYIDHLSSLKPLNYYNPGRNINVKLGFRF
ncbi:TonB-dependent receptor [Ancylomarina longa]|nr:TonB-dependent receptor [Ancylomarina longa]